MALLYDQVKAMQKHPPLLLYSFHAVLTPPLKKHTTKRIILSFLLPSFVSIFLNRGSKQPLSA